MPEFHYPAAFLLLLFIPLLFIFRKLGFFSRISLVTTFSNWNGKSFVWNKKVRNFISIFSYTLTLIAYILAVVAIADPVIYRQERIYTSRGTDIMFVLDNSPSMAAKDMASGTRFEVAKNAIKELVETNSGATFGIVSMGEEASITVPPTSDHKIFLERLDSIRIGTLGDGTAIGTGLSTAVFHLSTSSAPKKCIVLITDGENNAGAIHPETASELASRNNITVYALGIGTSGSVPLEYVDPKTGKNYSGFLSSTFDVSSLRQIAQVGGGRFFEIQSLNDLSLALTVITKNQNVVQTYHSKTTSYEIYDILIFISGLLFVASWIIRRIYLQELI